MGVHSRASVIIRLSVSLAVGTVVSGASQAAGPPTKESVARPSAEVIAAWESAGARFGWMRLQADSSKMLHFSVREQADSGEIPAFILRNAPRDRLKSLPAPQVPWGLSIW